MTLSRIGAAASVVSLAEAKAHVRVDSADEDALIQALVDAATDFVSQRTGLSLGEETWRFVSAPPSGDLRLPVEPARELTAVSWIDPNGAVINGDVGDFLLFGGERPTVRPDSGAWPVMAHRPDALTMTFTAGLEECPKALQVAVLLLVGHWHLNREAVTGGGMMEVPAGAGSLIDVYRRGWVAA